MRTADAVEEFIIEDIQLACLSDVLTIHEVCALWRKHHSTVHEHIKKGRLIARQTAVGRTWLVSKRSCLDKWGDPE